MKTYGFWVLRTGLFSLLFSLSLSLSAQQIYPNQASEIDTMNFVNLRLMAYRTVPDVREVVWSPGNLRFAVSAGNQVLIYNTFDLSQDAIVINHNNPVLDMAFNPDGSVLAVTSENELRLWRAMDGNLFQESPAINTNDIAYSQDGSLIAFADLTDGQLKIWNILTDEIIELGAPSTEDDYFINVDFSPDGQYVGALSYQTEMTSYELRSGNLLGRIQSSFYPDFVIPYQSWHDLFVMRDAGIFVLGNYAQAGILQQYLPDYRPSNLGDNIRGSFVTDFYNDAPQRSDDYVYTGITSVASAGDLVLATETDFVYIGVNPDLPRFSGGSYRAFFSHPNANSATFSSDKTQLISVGGDQIRIWRLEDDLFTRSQLGGFSQQVVDTDCNADNEPSIRSSQTTSASWSWFASTPEQVDEHIRYANYDIQFDGNPIDTWIFLSQVEQSGSDWVVYYYMPVGTLPWGRHGFLYNLTWSQVISDGYNDFGEGTDNVSLAGQCVFTISQN